MKDAMENQYIAVFRSTETACLQRNFCTKIALRNKCIKNPLIEIILTGNSNKTEQ